MANYFGFLEEHFRNVSVIMNEMAATVNREKIMNAQTENPPVTRGLAEQNGIKQ